MRETAVERRLVQRVQKAGGICMKIMPVVRGYPDRLCLFPGCRFRFVETKAPKGKLRPAQEVFRRKVAALGIPVAVLYDTRQVDAWVDEVLAE